MVVSGGFNSPSLQGGICYDRTNSHGDAEAGRGEMLLLETDGFRYVAICISDLR
jgi:hypothetical protein